MSAAEEPYHFSVEEFIAFCATDPDRYMRFELINGEIYPPMAESDNHASIVEDIADALRRTRQGLVRSHGSVILDGDGMPLPDVYIVAPGEIREGPYWNGRQLDLAVEVSVSTLRDDAGKKLRDYARGKVPVYWIVDATDSGDLIVYRHTEPYGDRYTRYETVPLVSLLTSLGPA